MTVELEERCMQLLEELLEVPAAEREGAFAMLTSEPPELLAELRARIAAAAEMPADFLPVPGNPTELHDLQPGEMVGVYRIRRQIGSSRMSCVYEAWDTHMERRIALKVLRRSAQDSAGLVRFEQELRTMAALEHPNIVTVHNGGMCDGVLYIVMQYLDGRDLAAAMEHAAYRNPRWVLSAALSLSGAFAAMHEAGIYHRDIKPQNIFVLRDSTLKVLDFGIARRNNGGHLTTTGYVACTPDYAPPEALAGDGPDHCWDIYSFGVVLYELLAGHRPVRDFQGVAPDTAPLRRAGAPPRLEDLIARCLSYDWKKRPASFREIEAVLQSVEAGSAPTQGRGQRLILPAMAAGLLAGGTAVAILLLRSPAPSAREGPAVVAAPADAGRRESTVERKPETLPPQVRGNATAEEVRAEQPRAIPAAPPARELPRPTVQLADPPSFELSAEAVQAGNVLTATGVPMARLTVPAAPAATAEAASAADKRAGARVELSKLLRLIEAAYSQGDVDKLQTLWPTIPSAHLQSLRQALDVGTVALQIAEAGEPRFASQNGIDTAEWPCQRSMLQTARGAQPGKPSVRRAVARFERRSNVWILVGLEY